MLRESVPRQVDKKSRVPEEEKGLGLSGGEEEIESGILKEERINFLSTFLSKDISEKAMARHSSTLAWKIPWMEEPGGLRSMGSRRVGHD